MERLPALALQLLQWQPDLIVTQLTPAAVAAARATRSLPIVMAASGDPVAAGVVHSPARPGGNVTGVAALAPELAAKSVELLRELQPALQRLGVLAHATDPFTPVMLQALAQAAEQLRLQLQVERVHEPAQYEALKAAASSPMRPTCARRRGWRPTRPTASCAARRRRSCRCSRTHASTC